MDIIKILLTVLTIIATCMLAVVRCRLPSCTLEELYKDRPRQSLVRTRLAEIFEHKFRHAIEESRTHSRYLIPAAEHFKKDLKKFFIDHGEALHGKEDLEILLKRLNYTRIPLFQAYKEDIEKFGTDLIID